MSPVVPVVSSLYAVVLALLGVVLTVRVILGRVRTGVQAGDGGDAALGQAIRAHANFAEQVPTALLVLVLLDAAGTRSVVVHALGAALVVARLVSARGLSRSLGATPQRQAGAGLTALVVTASALVLAWRVLPLLAR
jgi:uncharacterized membrane protein YecN with MAPEG domain